MRVLTFKLYRKTQHICGVGKGWNVGRLEGWDNFLADVLGVERWFEHNKPTRQSKDKFFC